METKSKTIEIRIAKERSKLEKELKEEREKNEKLREALAFYADERIWYKIHLTNKYDVLKEPDIEPIIKIAASIAKDALKKAG